MLSRLLLRPQESRELRYLFLAGLVVVLFAVGYLIGNVANTAVTNSPASAPLDAPRPSGAAVVDPPHRVQDFTLISDTGEPMALSELRGQTVMMFFGYTHCPDVCPTTLADYRRVKEALGDDADNVKFVFISVDGERDTPDVLAGYLAQYDSDFIGLVGDEQTLAQIGAEYGLYFDRETINVEHTHEDGEVHIHDYEDENYFVQHTSPSFLIDRDGYLRLVYFYGTEPEVIAEGIRQMLQ